MGSANPIHDAQEAQRRAELAARHAALRARMEELTSDAIDSQFSLETLAAGAASHNSSREEIAGTPHRRRRPESAARRFRLALWQPGKLGAEAGASALRDAPSSMAIDADSSPSDRIRRLWQKIPVWLVSAVLHAFLLVTLALLTYAPDKPAPPVIIADFRKLPDELRELDDDLEIGLPERAVEEPVWSPPPQASLSVPLPGALASETFSSEFEFESLLAEPFAPQLQLAEAPQVKRENKAAGAQFFGIQATGDRFVFIVDSSTSMTMKFANAKQELEEAVRRLNPEQMFYVVFFDRRAKRMHLGHWDESGLRFQLNPLPEPELVPATEENINAMVYWMNTIQLDNYTNPFEAVMFAVQQLKPDAIFLLSDGELRDGGATELFLARENLERRSETELVPRIIVHCVGFYSRMGEVTLQRIANTYGGTYRFVEPPAGWWPFAPGFGGRRGPRR